ncbi:MAG: hypothetical protein JJU32_10570 [Phormidium sp. BM_Day4_Bin.17]|nr:hypothetical protein [Phormidium sp. BM_Day4_Bin.17]UCJ12067.1 MAG: hypothetical protein JWS08_20575 [Phormidium sp. PBR-2020]
MVHSKPLKLYKQGQPIEFEDIGLLTVARDSHRFYFNVPIERCVWGYGWRYVKGEHPFLNFFEREESLDEFYRHYQPQNTLEALTLGFDMRPWDSLELPWHYSIVFVPDVKDRKKHKNQHLGPLRPDKLNREKLRLTTVLDSIKSEGYQPEKYGYPNPHICGYFLLKDDDFLFYIEGGKHRATALVELGYESLPVISLPDTYFVSHETLSGLAGATYTEDDLPIVRTMFESYFDSRLREGRKQLLAEWMRRASGGSVVVF